MKCIVSYIYSERSKVQKYADLSEERFENTPDGSEESLFSLSESLTRKGIPSKAFTGTAVIFLLLRSRRTA